MEFKEAIKIRRRICDCYKGCDGCPLGKLSPNCVYGLLKVENTDGYERILEEWVKEHTVMTNIDKYIEVIKNTFDGTKFDKNEVRQGMCPKLVGKEIDSNECAIMRCSECLKWWDEEYKEPEKEKEE